MTTSKKPRTNTNRATRIHALGWVAMLLVVVLPLPLPTATAAAPSDISAITPNNGKVAGGDEVTIRVTGVSTPTPAVFFGSLSVPATDITVVDSPSGNDVVKVKAPAQTTNGAVVVRVCNTPPASECTPGTFTSNNANRYSYGLVAHSINANNGPTNGGTSFSITGAGFGTGDQSSANCCYVKFGTRYAPDGVAGHETSQGVDSSQFLEVTDTITSASIAGVTPDHASGFVNVRVERKDDPNIFSVLTNAFEFRTTTPPTVTGATPSAGPSSGGTIVKIAGSNFGLRPQVYFRTPQEPESAATLAPRITWITPSEIEVDTPPHGPGAVGVQVKNLDGQSNTRSNAYTYGGAAQMVVESVSPNTARSTIADTITITGQNFDENLISDVFIGSESVGFTFVSSTTLTATTNAAVCCPKSGTNLAVKVVNLDDSSAELPNAFSYIPIPTITSLSPNNGPTTGGTLVTITGAGFQPTPTILLGGAPMTEIEFVDGTQVKAKTPSNSFGPKTIEVTNPDAQKGTLASAYTFLAAVGPPTVTLTCALGTGAIDANPACDRSVNTNGGKSLRIVGQGFQQGATVHVIGGNPATTAAATGVVVDSPTQIRAVTPAHAPCPTAGFTSPCTIKISNPDGQTCADNHPSAPRCGQFNFTTAPPPSISTMSPTSSTGSNTPGVVTITGSGFSAPPALPPIVRFGSQPSTQVVVNTAGTQILVVPPPQRPSGVLDVTVINPDGQSTVLGGATQGFTYVLDPTPIFTLIEPVSGSTNGGFRVTISGANFIPGSTTTRVNFNGGSTVGSLNNMDATSVVVVTTTEIRAIAPRHTPCPIPPASPTSPPGTACTVTVFNPDGASNGRNQAFTFNPATAPAVTSLNPASGPTIGGTVVSITGSGFSGVHTVEFGGIQATNVEFVSATEIRATVPARGPAGPVNVVVKNRDVTAASGTKANGYTYTEAPVPTVSGITPTSGPTQGETVVTITGSSFPVAPAVAPTVKLGGIQATVGSYNANQIVATTKTRLAGPAEVLVTNPDGRSGTLLAGYTYLLPPQLHKMAPTTGIAAGGQTVTFTGLGFLPPPAAPPTVTFGGTAATNVVVTGPTTFTAQTPGRSGVTTSVAVDVAVTNPDGQIDRILNGFTYTSAPAPTISTVTPNSGSANGGDTVTLAGTGFLPAPAAPPTVTLGGTPATNVVVAGNGLSVTLKTAGHAPGLVHVILTNPDGKVARKDNSFTFNAAPAPTFASLAPTTGASNAGETVSLAGTNFATGATVTFGGTSAQVTGLTATQVTVKAPPRGSAGAVPVAIRNPDGQTVTLNNAYNYTLDAAPAFVAAGVAPKQGPASGGTAVTIAGTNFADPPSGAPTVTFGGTAGTVTAVTATQISVTTPAHASGLVNVVVTNPDGQTVNVPNAFAFGVVVATVAPNNGTTLGGTSIVVTGFGFATGAKINLGGTDCATASTTFISATEVRCTSTPAHSSGPVAVRVTNPDNSFGELAGAYTYFAPPQATSLNPTSGTTNGGVLVTITGTGFQVTPPAGTKTLVAFGGVAATDITVVSATSITARIPARVASGAVAVRVTNPDGQFHDLNNGFTYNAAPAPTISSASPNTGATNGGTLVTIGGTNFAVAPAAKPNVTFGGVPGTVQEVTATQIKVLAPAYPTGGIVAVKVQNPDTKNASLAGGFNYNRGPQPSISGITPTGGNSNGGTVITINGANFAIPPAAKPNVTFGGVHALEVTVVSASQLTVKAPPRGSAGAVSVVVRNPDDQSATLPNAFTYALAAAPALTGLTPSSGPSNGGTTVTITGSNFAVSPAPPPTVSFGGTPAASVTVTSATELTAVSPGRAAGATTVSLANPDGQAATQTLAFTYTEAPAPTVTSLTPSSGPSSGGTTVTITGTGFGPGATVSFGGTNAASRTVVSATQITAVTPSRPAGVAAVTVRNGDGRTGTLASGFTFTAGAPVVSSLNATTGSTNGGTPIAITGTGFVSGATVTFGGRPATGIVVESSTRIRAVTPANPAGPVAVKVRNADAQEGTLNNAYTYVLAARPTVTDVSPSSGPSNGGSNVSITGTNFVRGATVTFGGTASTKVTFFSATRLTAITPGHASGPVIVVVGNPDAQTGQLANAFNYIASPAPSVSGLKPGFGPSNGGTTVYVLGANFANGATVGFGGSPATNVTFVGPTNLTVKSPAHAIGRVEVTVTNPDGQTASLADAYLFTLGPAPVLLSINPTQGTTNGGTKLELAGSNFASSVEVKIGGVKALNVSVTGTTKISVETPPRSTAGAVDVRVEHPDLQFDTLAAAFTYVLAPAPQILSVSPTRGPGGVRVTLVGTGFAQGASIQFGGASAPGVVVASDTTITATAPPQPSGVVDVRVVNPDLQAARLGNAFTYESISYFLPTQAEQLDNGSIRVTWTVPTDVAGQNITSFQIWRAASPFTLLTTLPGSDNRGYVDTSAEPGKAYRYVVSFLTASSIPFQNITLVPGYTSDDQLPDSGGVEGGAGGLPRWAWIAIGIGALIVVAVIVAVSLAGRRREGGGGQQAATVVEGGPESETPVGSEAAPPGPEEAGAEKHRLRCPACSHRFEVAGSKPIVTVCPSCGRKGILR